MSDEHPEMFDTDRDDLGHLNIRCFLQPEFVEPVSDYVAAFRALRPDSDRLVLGMIVGVPLDTPACVGPGDDLAGCLSAPRMAVTIDPVTPTQFLPSCSTMMGNAYPPTRFVELAQTFGEDAFVQSICETDWRPAVQAIAGRLAAKLTGACFPAELPLDECRAPCRLIETYSDARPCAVDPACPQEWCPPASADDGSGQPCVAPATSIPCEPSKRDLGLCVRGDCVGRRRCLVRQAMRFPESGDRCSSPVTTGWYYVPEGAYRNEPGCADTPPPCVDPSCPQIVLSAGAGEALIEPGSEAELRCAVGG